MPRNLGAIPGASEAYERAPLRNLQEALGMTITITGAELREMPPNKEIKAILRTDRGDFVSAQRGIKQQAQAIADALAGDPDPIVAFVQAVEGDRAYGNTLVRLVDVPEWNKDTIAALARLLAIPLDARKALFDQAGGEWPALASLMQDRVWEARRAVRGAGE